MKVVQRTALFDRWLRRLRDGKAVDRIETRITRLRLGNPGDHKYLGGGLAEMRIDHGPGYRLYFCEQGGNVILLLCGGDKSSQGDDIAKARAMIDMIEEL
jgi:putative addiction module killer protein